MRFRLILSVVFLATLGLKLLVAGPVENPSDSEIAESLTSFFLGQGFQVAGLTTFAGRQALLIHRGDCLAYVVPVAQQGWHQATVREAMSANQHLFFEFRGEISVDRQMRWYPLLVYYAFKIARYAGMPEPYPPVLALVTSGSCDVAKIDWASMPEIQFRRV
jgi:hypothetical protein